VVHVRFDFSEERIASIIRVKRISEQVTMLSLMAIHLQAIANVPSPLILGTLMMEAIRSFEASVLRKATRPHIPRHSS
jgi:hypothetical protein